MFKCKDPLADMLKNYGYNLVLMPRPTIEPLQVLSKEGSKLELVGHIRDLFKRGDTAPMPRKSKDIPLVQELQNEKTAGIDARIGVNILANFLKPMGSKAKAGSKKDKEEPDKPNSLSAVFANVDKFIFSYHNVKENSINLIKLDEFIHDATINEKARAFSDKLKAGKLFIITSTIKSNSFSTECTDKRDAGVDIGIPDVKKVIGGNVSIKGEKEHTHRIVYEGDEELIFGFKAVRLLYEDDTKSFKIKSADGVVMRGEEDFPVEKLETGDAFVQFGE